jgi:hypothetical protein
MAMLESAAAAESSRPRTWLEPGASARVSSWLARRFDSLRDLWDGASWEPGHDWLTRVAPAPGDRQEPS